MSLEADWEKLLSAAAFVQTIVPDAIMVGGSAAALHAGHRYSADDDHVVVDLKSRFAAVLADLEAVAGWTTARVQSPVQILGNLSGVETGIRNEIRSAPLEITAVEGSWGTVVNPTLPEMLRIKAWLVVTRNATRDYLDVAALAERLGSADSLKALGSLDALYPQANGESVLRQLARQLAEPIPYDLGGRGLEEYRIVRGPWDDWEHVRIVCMALATQILSHVGL